MTSRRRLRLVKIKKVRLSKRNQKQRTRIRIAKKIKIYTFVIGLMGLKRDRTPRKTLPIKNCLTPQWTRTNMIPCRTPILKIRWTPELRLSMLRNVIIKNSLRKLCLTVRPMTKRILQKRRLPAMRSHIIITAGIKARRLESGRPLIKSRIEWTKIDSRRALEIAKRAWAISRWVWTDHLQRLKIKLWPNQR